MSRSVPAGNEALFRTLFETAPDAMVAINRAGDIILANPQAHRLFGYPPEGLLGLRIERLLPESAREAHIAHRARYMEQPRVRPLGAGFEVTGVRRSGEAFPVEIALSPIGSELFAASIRDISETQRARQALQRARFDTYLARLGRLVLESGHDESARAAVPALLAEALASDGVAVAYGTPGGDALPVRAASGLSPELCDALASAFARDDLIGWLAGKDPIGWTLARDGADGLPALRSTLAAHGFADAAIVPLLDRHQPTGILLACTHEPGAYDSGKLQFLQLAANLLAAAIQRSRSEEQLAHSQRLDALGQLTGGIAHDFNNQLTIVSGNLQILEAEYGCQADARGLIDSATRAVDRCINLTRKLLGFARRRSLTARPLQPQQILAELEEMLVRTLGAGISISVQCPVSMGVVHADAGELEAALVNLALNARDAMPGGGHLRISACERHIHPDAAATAPAGSYVSFVVEDSGTGMSREVLARAPEPFFTTKGAAKGSGLGLSMVYGFVKQSGGHMHIESQPGQGTRVEFLLPAAAVPDERPDAGTQAASRPGSALVLVVEDEPGVRQVARRFLRSLGYGTIEAADAGEALGLLHGHPEIRLLFSDVVLASGQTGFELVREARRLRPGLPALLTSGYERSATGADDVLRSGIELLRKPYRIEQLGEALARALDHGGG